MLTYHTLFHCTNDQASSTERKSRPEYQLCFYWDAFDRTLPQSENKEILIKNVFHLFATKKNLPSRDHTTADGGTPHTSAKGHSSDRADSDDRRTFRSSTYSLCGNLPARPEGIAFRQHLPRHRSGPDWCRDVSAAHWPEPSPGHS